MYHPSQNFSNEELNSLHQKMETTGYASLIPPITPETLITECENNQLLQKCVESMFSYCVRYAHDVFTMMLEQKKVEQKRIEGEDTKEESQELKEIDTRRHILHEAMIGSVNTVMREFNKQGKNDTWMREISSEGRAGYARFALLTFYQMYSKVK